jgi:uncharacterized protein
MARRSYPVVMTSDEIVSLLDLQPHPDGGYFREVYRATEVLHLPRGLRPAWTSYYALLTSAACIALHRVASDQVWHFYCGDPLEIIWLTQDGRRTDKQLGLDLAAGARPQVVVPARSWYGARVAKGGSWTLIGCTIAPAPELADFDLGERAALNARFPAHGRIIAELTVS